MTQGGPIIAITMAAVAAADEHYIYLYLICILLDRLCVDGIDGENILDEETATAVAVGVSVIEHWSTVSGIAAVWSG